MNAKEFAKIAAAFAEDPTSVQIKDGPQWLILGGACDLYSTNEYRLTPKPREWWMVLDRDGDVSCTSKSPVDAADIASRRASGCYAPYTVVHVVEVLP